MFRELDDKPNVSSDNRLESIRDAHNNERREGKEERIDTTTDAMEDYLEVMYELIQKKGYATTIDIANYLHVSSPSVTKMVKRLDKMGYLVYEKYRGLQLTSEGIAVAKNIHKNHDLLVEFLKMIGIDEEIANRDAEGIEHHLHPQTMEKLEEFIKRYKRKK
ncbi:MAG: transcriptional regulator MntR [Nitrosopumilus sp.]|nr:transcriptional regulator MntR [Nitrosopumilus sp.]